MVTSSSVSFSAMKNGKVEGGKIEWNYYVPASTVLVTIEQTRRLIILVQAKNLAFPIPRSLSLMF